MHQLERSTISLTKSTIHISFQRLLSGITVKSKWHKYAYGVIMMVALGYQLRHRLALINFKDIHIQGMGWVLIGAVVLLMALNWLLEATKWKMAMNKPKMSLRAALETVLVGLSFAVWTPGRIGDYAGRALHSNEGEKSMAVLATFISSAAQLTVSLSLGFISILMVLILRDVIVLQATPLLLIFPILFAVFLFLKAEWLAMKISRMSMFRSIDMSGLQNLSTSGKMNILGLSFLRYVTYSIQMVLLLAAFELNIPFLDAIFGVSILFLLQTLIPMPMLFQVATKIELALILWAPFDPSIAVLSFIMLSLWMINVVCPSFIGYRLINFKIFKNTQNNTI